MTETNQNNIIPEAQQAFATAPVLTLEPVTAASSQMVLDEASAAIEDAMNAAPKAEAEAEAKTKAKAEAKRYLDTLQDLHILQSDDRQRYKRYFFIELLDLAYRL